MRVFVMAQGKAKRFPGKHLVTIAGEPIVHRTARFLKHLPDKHRVTLIAPDEPIWRNVGLPIVTLPDTGESILDGIAATRYLWDDEHIVYLLGDVVFSPKAFKQAMIRPPEDKPAFVGRWGPNRVTGCPWGEIFALCLYQAGRDVVHQELASVRGQLWMLCHHLGKDVRGVWREVHDFTDDVDYPIDLERFRRIEHLVARDGGKSPILSAAARSATA